jgi:hypothetical protein
LFCILVCGIVKSKHFPLCDESRRPVTAMNPDCFCRFFSAVDVLSLSRRNRIARKTVWYLIPCAPIISG